MAGIHLNTAVWTGIRLPNYIADVVLSYFPKFYSYIYSICGALSQTVLLITDFKFKTSSNLIRVHWLMEEWEITEP